MLFTILIKKRNTDDIEGRSSAISEKRRYVSVQFLTDMQFA